MPKHGQAKGTPARRAEFIESLRGLGPGEDHVYWPWSDFRGGYARVYINGKKVNAHRWVYEQLFGPLPDRNGPGATGSDLVLHTCDVRPCMRPSHLYVGDANQNSKDAQNRGRLRGKHLTDDEVTYLRNAYALGVPGTKLAAVFGVSIPYVYDLVHRRRRA